MDQRLKMMQDAWAENSKKYPDLIGITGRRPVEEEFDITVADVTVKLNLDEPGIDSILDVGCSNGYLLHRVSGEIANRFGVDFCQVPLVQAHSLFPEAHYCQADASVLPFQSHTFDRVLCYNMFHYLPSEDAGFKLCRELNRILKVNGRLLIGDIFTQEHKHLIPQDDFQRWSDPSRKFMHQIQNWLFMPVKEMQSVFNKLGSSAQILPQHPKTRSVDYRFDLVVMKGNQS